MSYRQKYAFRKSKCPKCGQEMQGFTLSYHYSRCPGCGTEFHGFGAKTTNDFQWILGLISVVGLIIVLASIAGNN
jgi:uncharacterized protein (DUF983 family)